MKPFRSILSLMLLGAVLLPAAPVSADTAMIVNTGTDETTTNGLCSLREAIHNANNNFATYPDCRAGFVYTIDTITFAGDYIITLHRPTEFAPATLNITSSIIINGNGSAGSIIQITRCNPVTLPGGCTPAREGVFFVSSIGNLTLNGLTVRFGNFSDAYAGSGIDNNGTLTIMKSRIAGNRGRTGGGISNEGTLIVTNSTITGNEAASVDSHGGGIYNYSWSGTVTITNSTISDNRGNFGGGIYNSGGMMTVTNSTISGNVAYSRGGGIYNNDKLIITNSTVSGNSAPYYLDGGGLFNSGTLHYSNTLIANSPTGGECSNFGTISTNLNNLVEDNFCFPALSGDPNLGPLASNGGPTQTQALLTGSPAIDAGSDANCPATDQRGVARPRGAHCDIGAYEVEFRPLISGNVGVAGAVLSYTDGTPKTVTADNNGNYSISVPVGWSGTVKPSKNGQKFTPISQTYSNVQTDQTNQNYTAQPATGGGDTTGVFRPSNGLLYLKNKNESGFADIAINYGTGGDYPVVGDWNGDGTDTIGIYRNGTFYLRNSNTIGFADLVFSFGMPGDQPIAGDWNNDGIDTIGVFRNGTFYLRNSNDAGVPEISFGLGNPGDVGIAGDWDGDGLDTTGVFRPSNGVIFLTNSNSTGFADIALNYGLPGDQPVMGDWNNDGKDTIGVYREGTFYLRNSNTNGFAEIIFGLGNPGDMPIAGNWDGLP